MADGMAVGAQATTTGATTRRPATGTTRDDTMATGAGHRRMMAPIRPAATTSGAIAAAEVVAMATTVARRRRIGRSTDAMGATATATEGATNIATAAGVARGLPHPVRNATPACQRHRAALAVALPFILPTRGSATRDLPRHCAPVTCRPVRPVPPATGCSVKRRRHPPPVVSTRRPVEAEEAGMGTVGHPHRAWVAAAAWAWAAWMARHRAAGARALAVAASRPYRARPRRPARRLPVCADVHRRRRRSVAAEGRRP